MDLGKLAFFFIQGFLVGSGPCLLTCAPLLLPYIAGTKRDWRAGLEAVLIFGLTRVAVYVLLGGIVGYVGAYLFPFFYGQVWGRVVWAGAGTFVIIAGGLMVFGRRFDNPFCSYFQQTKSLVLLGVIVALAPCLPLLAVLTEIMFTAGKFYQGFLYGLAFGLGTLVSPLLLVGAVAPLIPVKKEILNVLCGLLLIAAGLVIFLRL